MKIVQKVLSLSLKEAEKFCCGSTLPLIKLEKLIQICILISAQVCTKVKGV